MASSHLRPSEPATPTTPRTPRSFQQFLANMNARAQKRASSSRHGSFPDLFPILPNPFEHTHPALRSPRSTRSVIDPAVASPAPTVTRFSAMASNPFSGRSSFFTRRNETAAVLDYGGNVPIHMPGSRLGSDLDEVDVEEQREWPSTAGRRRRRRTRKRTPAKTSAPILFPAMQSRRVRIKLLHTIIVGSILILLLIIYFALQKINANLESFQIFFVLMFIFLAIALAHCLLRLYLLTRRWNIRQLRRAGKESIYAPSDRAIPVILARDEEIGIGGSTIEDKLEEDSPKTVAFPPPAYGLWRGSVRVDPNLLHWQRVNRETEPPTPEIPTEHRPPIYTPPVQQHARMEGGFF